MHDQSEEAGTAERVADTAHDVAAEATDQVRAIGEQVRSQSEDLAGSARTQIADQLVRGKDQLATTLRQLADEFDEIAPHASGTVADLSDQASGAAHGLSEWLDDHEPRDVLRAVEDIARRRPMRFLLVSAVAGVLVGRVTRSMISADGDDRDVRPSPAGHAGNGEGRERQAGNGDGRVRHDFEDGTDMGDVRSPAHTPNGLDVPDPSELELTGRVPLTGSSPRPREGR